MAGDPQVSHPIIEVTRARDLEIWAPLAKVKGTKHSY